MTHSTPQRAKDPVAIFWVVVAVAFLIRLIYILQLSNPNLNPTFIVPAGDAGVHHRWAQALLSGQWPEPGPFFRAPLYPYFLGLLYAVFGAHNPLPVQLVHGLVSALGAGLAALSARHLWSTTAAWSAGLLLAVLWPSIYFSGELLAVTLSVTLNLLVLWLLLGKLTSRRLLGLGIALGLSAITRPTVLVVVPVIIWFLWQRRALGGRASLSGWLWLALGLSLTVGPVTIRNLVRGGEPVLIAASGGVNFYIGNNPHADGRVAFLPGAPPTWQGELSDALALTQAETGRQMTAQQADRYFWGKGLQFWRDEPRAAVSLLAHKAWLLAASGARSNNKNLAFWRARSPLLRWPIWPGWALILGLAVLGISRADLDSDRRRLLLGLSLVYAAALLLFFINARFRLPLLAWLVVPAGGGLATLIAARRERTWSQLPRGPILAAVLVTALSVIPDLLTYHQNPATDFNSWQSLGNSYLATKNKAGAIEAWETALTIDARDPLRANRWWLPRIYQPLAQLYVEQRQFDTAAGLYRQWIARLPEATGGRMGLADLLLQTGHPDEARVNLAQVVAREPDNHNARLGLAWSLQRTERPAKALVEFETVARNIDSPSADFGIGVSLLALGQLAAAESQFQTLVGDQPGFWQAYENLADLYARTGQTAKERQSWQRLLKYQPNNKHARQRLALLR